MHETNVFVMLHDQADEDLIAAIAETFTPELAKKISVSPAERVAREAEKIRLTKQLEDTNGLLESFSRLVGHDPRPPSIYLPKDIEDLKKYKATIDEHLSTAALYEQALSIGTILKLPRRRLDATWYRLSSLRGADMRSFMPRHIATRFNGPSKLGGGFSSMAFAEDIPTATFELGAHVDLTENIEYLKRMTLAQIRVQVSSITDLGDSESVSQGLGIDFSALTGIGLRDRISVTQKLCALLVEAGFEGAIFPSPTTLGKKNLVLFEQNIETRNSLEVIFSGRLKSS